MSVPSGSVVDADRYDPVKSKSKAVGYAVTSICLTLAGVGGLAASIAAAVALPTHEDGGHGGDGAVAVLVVLVGMVWLGICNTAGFAFAIASSVQASRATGPHPRIATAALVVAVVPIAVGIVAVTAQSIVDMW